jgi:hypothetical protein
VRLRIEGADDALLVSVQQRLTTAAGNVDLALPAVNIALQVEVVSTKGPPTIFDLQPTSLHAVSRAVLQTPGDDPSDLIYSTHLGGSSWDQVNAIAVDAAGQATIAGITKLSAFPTTPGAYDPSYNGGDHDAFVARLSADGKTLVYGTFLGGSQFDSPTDIAADDAGQVTLTGNTVSNDFPAAPGAFDTSHSGFSNDYDAFIARLSADGRTLSYGTFLGGRQSDRGYALALDSQGRAIAAGMTASDEFPTTPGAFNPWYPYGIAGFVSKLYMYAPNVLAPIEQPGPTSIIAGMVILSGFAVDLNSQAETGVDGVDIYLDGASGTGTLIGHATYGLSRPDVAPRYGARFGPSGWELAWDTTGLALVAHTLHLYAHLTTNDTWSELPPRLVIVPRGQLVWLPLIAKNR